MLWGLNSCLSIIIHYLNNAKSHEQKKEHGMETGIVGCFAGIGFKKKNRGPLWAVQIKRILHTERQPDQHSISEASYIPTSRTLNPEP